MFTYTITKDEKEKKEKIMFKILTNNGKNKIKMAKVDKNSKTYFNTEFGVKIGYYSNLKIGEQFEIFDEQNVWIVRTNKIEKIELFSNNQINIITESGSEYVLVAI